MNDPNDPNEYLDDNDGTLEFPSGDVPYSYADLEFTSGHYIDGTITLSGCNGDVTNVNVVIIDENTNNVAGSDNPNNSGYYYVDGLSDGTYTIEASLNNYNTKVNTSNNISGGNHTQSLSLNPHTGDFRVRVKDNNGDAVNNATVTLFTASDSSIFSGPANPNNNIANFTSECMGDYFITVYHGSYYQDTTEILTLNNDGQYIERTINLAPKEGYVTIDLNNADDGTAIAGADISSNGYTASESNGQYTLTMPFGTYDITVVADGYHSQTLSDVQVLAEDTTNRTVDLTPNHFTFEGGNANDAMWSLFLEEIDIDDIPVETNDEIAIYEADTLVGVYHVDLDDDFSDNTSSAAATRVLKAYSTLDNGDGYEPGNDYSFEIYDHSTGNTYTPTSVSVSGGTYGGGSGFPSGINETSYITLKYYSDETMNFNLEAGYQMISARVTVSETNMDSIFNPIKANLDLVKDEN
ncbi:MAG: carboxypeptidase-like regulatory domain-containing protein [Bacteroidales bacterium]|nr:carboxypeptidase-like regulatory domain-containing protein [Bacteroidales bacterium]